MTPKADGYQAAYEAVTTPAPEATTPPNGASKDASNCSKPAPKAGPRFGGSHDGLYVTNHHRGARKK